MASEIFRVWLYREVRALKNHDLVPSVSNRAIVVQANGGFKYFKRIGSLITETNRKEAWKYRRAGKKIVTYRGYPPFMLAVSRQVFHESSHIQPQ